MDEINILLELRTADEAAYRARERALRRQIANVSHDLRTPLTSILGYLQLLEGDALSDEERARYLAVVESRAKVLQELITSFYDLSRLEAGEYPIAREPVDLREVVSGLLAAFYEDLERKFTVTVDIPDVLPPVWGDKAALGRVYTNLVRNALEHGGNTLSVVLRAASGGVESVFENGGADLADEDVPHVFDRFFTSDKSRTGRNTGLGLAIVKTLTDQMGGTAGAGLERDRFRVTLTWKAAPAVRM